MYEYQFIANEERSTISDRPRITAKSLVRACVLLDRHHGGASNYTAVACFKDGLSMWPEELRVACPPAIRHRS